MNITATQWAQFTAAEKATCRAIFLEEEMLARKLEPFYFVLPIPDGAIRDGMRDAYLAAISRGVELDRLVAAAAPA